MGVKSVFQLVLSIIPSDTNLARNFGEGEVKSGGDSEILKVQFFFSILLTIFGIRGANWSPTKCKGVF